MRFSTTRLGDILRAFQKSRILVVGDVMLDEFLWGKVTRISPEAPVPVVEVRRRTVFPGGAANVARSLASLGAQVAIAGVLGNDEPGRQLVNLLEREGIACGGLRATPQRPTTH